ncbi:hypothetical protein BRW65_01810 [Mycobacterium paraffinicum]|uniref:6-phosphogluconate dehydrogenase n=1 Tax=Mycobacterium paraffinicum TaxID=53378 RepID=A0A1Q4I2U6_9MYCO|nr:hypothetical protein BRW65_01810 [Mycobacterium paraffinicum]
MVGLGAIGTGIVVSLLRSGRTPLVFDVRPDAADGIEGISQQEASAAELARGCDVVLLAVFDEEQARHALAGPGGILAGALPGSIVVVLSTVPVAAVKEFHTMCAAHDVALLDCGVTPGDQAAHNGLVGLLGGPDHIVARALPVLKDFARAIVHCGPVGAGMTAKIARNLITYATWAAVDEAADLAVAGGVDLPTFLEALRETEAEHAQPLKMLEVRTFPVAVPQDRIANAINVATKDLDAATALAAARGVATPLTEAVKPLMGGVFAGRRPAARPI